MDRKGIMRYAGPPQSVSGTGFDCAVWVLTTKLFTENQNLLPEVNKSATSANMQHFNAKERVIQAKKMGGCRDSLQGLYS
jgi:hypothetical protein